MILDWFPVRLSLQIGVTALALILVPACLLAWLGARGRLRGARFWDTLLFIPLVLPPSVVGYLLVRSFSPRSAIGGALESLGIQVLLTPLGAVLASSLAALPLLTKTLQPAFSAVPSQFEEVAASLGLNPLRVFLRVTVPVSWRALVAGSALALARAIGEFGATLMVAGYVPGRTNTIPLEIYSAYQAGEDERAAFYVIVMVLFSVAVATLSAHWGQAIAGANGRKPVHKAGNP